MDASSISHSGIDNLGHRYFCRTDLRSLYIRFAKSCRDSTSIARLSEVRVEWVGGSRASPGLEKNLKYLEVSLRAPKVP